MSTAKKDIRDWPRGTTPPFRLSVSDAGSPFDLVGSTIVMVVREEEWTDSDTDNTALMKRRATFYEVASRSELPTIVSPKIGDIAWVDDISLPVEYDGLRWNDKNPNENDIKKGVYTIRFSRQETMIPVGTYFYSIDIKFTNGEIAKIVKGKISITANTVNEI